jgi:DNA-directed RNA polymerase specialized sigma24 family protein
MDLADLIMQVRAGNVEAYRHVVRRFQGMACGYALALLGDHHRAEDAAQEAFVEAYRNIDGLNDPAAFPGWFRQTCDAYPPAGCRGRWTRAGENRK